MFIAASGSLIYGLASACGAHVMQMRKTEPLLI